MSAPDLGLIGDVGATNARFALVQPDGITTAARVYALNDYTSLTEAISAYLAEESPAARPEQAVLAVASPVTGDQVTLTNHPWTFSIEAVRKHFGLRRFRVINDFAANAVAIPHLADSDRLQIGPGSPVANAPIGLIGPGTGLGVSALMPMPGGLDADRGRRRTRDNGADGRPGECGAGTHAQTLRSCLGGTSSFRSRSRQSLQCPLRVGRSAGCAHSRRRKSPTRGSGAKTHARATRRRCSVRCSGPWPAISP